MPMKGSGAAELREIDRWDGGVGWLAYPEEELRRASHALAVDGDVWVVDPVDAPGLDNLLAGFGDVAGVVVCVDRHTRDASKIAVRHDVPVYAPDWMTGVESKLNARLEWFSRGLAGTGYRAITVANTTIPPWQEAALYREDDGTLYVPESLGTAPFFLARSERLGVHPMRRPVPPTDALGGLDPRRVLVGHGEGVLDGASEALADTLDGARRRLPAAYADIFRRMVLD